ncbi:MAG TPA: thiamine phosphate synthase [Terriglobales bacterium]|nr:thiamine phosphate synthase [Terriglobales bacterium]
MVRERSVLLYYITDRNALGDDEAERLARLLDKITEAARAGVDCIQLREKDLTGRDLESLTRAAVNLLAQANAQKNRDQRTRILINSRVDIALACAADGVHLRSDDVSPCIAREIYDRAACGVRPIISVSCHNVNEVACAAEQGADFALFAPVFGKPGQKNAPAIPASGLDALRKACEQKIPVIALGGVTVENAIDCLNAGATGIAAIRLFQENDIAEVVQKLRSLQ